MRGDDSWKIKPLTNQADDCDRIAGDMECSISCHSAWYKFSDPETAALAKDTAAKFRKRAKALRVGDAKARVEWAVKALKKVETE